MNFGSTLVVAMREDVPEGPFIQSLPSELTRSQLHMMSQGLQDSVLMVCPDAIKKDRHLQREQLVHQYLRQERKEHSHILNRKSVIEARKEKIESMRNKLVRIFNSFVLYGEKLLKFYCIAFKSFPTIA